jgi:predicted nucleic acid-binding protein
MGAERLVFVDTNVLVAATDAARATHRAALAMLEAGTLRGDRLATSGQVLREYLCVATRPLSANGTGLSMAAALDNVAQFTDRMTLLGEPEKVSLRLRTLLAEVPCAGKQVHDANIVATMLTHAVRALVTRNTDDFTRFGHWIEVESLPG